MADKKRKTKRVSLSMVFPKDVLADPRITREVGVLKCVQCGRCSAGCPAADIYEDFSPRELMHRLHLGEIDEILTEETIWRCGQCYTCHSRCPRGNSPAIVILALREMAIKRGITCVQAASINSSILKNINETGETMSPNMVTPELLLSFGPEAVDLWKTMPERRAKMGLSVKTGRKEEMPQKAVMEVRILLEASMPVQGKKPVAGGEMKQ